MPTISEGDLTFQFPSGSHVGKYDDWAFYQNELSKIPGTKAVDFVCVHGRECWLIEVKDYRFHPRTKPTNIAQRALRTRRWRVVLHLEQSQHPSRLRPTPIDPANVRMNLRKVLRGIDPHAVVADAARPRGPWAVET